MIASFPFCANSGRCRLTKSSNASIPRSTSCAMATAVIGFPAESHNVSVSGCIATPGRASPRATSASTSPRHEMYSCAPGWRMECIPSSSRARVFGRAMVGSRMREAV